MGYRSGPRSLGMNDSNLATVWITVFPAGVSFSLVRSPDEASSRENAYDYVILCVKALPDVYDLGAVIESVVTPQHTCILVNTTNTLGVESQLEHRFPTNVVLSLVSNVNIVQTGPSEFEHDDSTEIWVGPASRSNYIPLDTQNDMASALALTLCSGHVDCKVSSNIKQEQFDRMIGQIAFFPTSVLFEAPNHAQLLEKVGVRQLVSDVIDELIELAVAQGCHFSDDFRQKTMERLVAPSDTPSTMYQDFLARRPLEVETYLGSPIKLAIESGVHLPRIETMYAMLHHINVVNQSRPRHADSPPPLAVHPPRISSVPPGQRPMTNGIRPSRAASGMSIQAQPRRGPPPPVGGGQLRPPSAQPSPRLVRESSFEDNALEEFSHLVMYDDFPEGSGVPPNGNGNYMEMPNGAASASADLALRERELMLRQRELQLREREMNMRRGGGGGRRGPPPRPAFDEEDEGDYVDPMDIRPPPHIDPDSIDMMSVTSRRRKAPSANQFRKNPEMGGSFHSRPPSSFGRYMPGGRKSSSSRMIQDISGMHDSLLDDPMMGYSSNRYGSVDRKEMHVESRANSLTAGRMSDFNPGPGPYPPSRRTSQSPGMSSGPNGRGMMGRPPPGHDPAYWPPNGMPPNGMPPNGMPPNGMPPNGMPPNGMPPNRMSPNGISPAGRPSPPGNMRAPIPRYPGHGTAVAPQQVENLGVSNSYSAKRSPNVRSLTGSASASAESGDSGASANIDSENSAHSSQISLGPQQSSPMLVR
ncbi:Ketopantoate reductase PanE/ApbA C terminal domain containing protein [Elaphomyces granulatus]